MLAEVVRSNSAAVSEFRLFYYDQTIRQHHLYRLAQRNNDQATEYPMLELPENLFLESGYCWKSGSHCLMSVLRNTITIEEAYAAYRIPNSVCHLSIG